LHVRVGVLNEIKLPKFVRYLIQPGFKFPEKQKLPVEYMGSWKHYGVSQKSRTT